MIQFEAEGPAPLPGPGPTPLTGRVIVVPIATTATDKLLLGRAAYLMGWSFRESTGGAGAIAELFDGQDANGSLAAAICLDRAQDSAAAQQPADAQASGAASVLAPSIGGAAGTIVFITSLEIEGAGATAGSLITATLSGVSGGSVFIPVTVPTGAGVELPKILMTFPGPGLQASAAGQAITLTVPSFGAGNASAIAAIQGYIRLVSADSQTQWLGPDGIYMQVGMFLHLINGSVRGSIWIRS